MKTEIGRQRNSSGRFGKWHEKIAEETFSFIHLNINRFDVHATGIVPLSHLLSHYKFHKRSPEHRQSFFRARRFWSSTGFLSSELRHRHLSRSLIKPKLCTHRTSVRRLMTMDENWWGQKSIESLPRRALDIYSWYCGGSTVRKSAERRTFSVARNGVEKKRARGIYFSFLVEHYLSRSRQHE